MWSFISVVSFLGAIVFLILGFVSRSKKKENAKKNFQISGIAIVIFFIALAASPHTKTEPQQDASVSSPSASVAPSAENSPQTAEMQAAEEEAAKLQAQQEADQQAKAEQEAQRQAEKSFDANGTFVVNEEVKPGLYRSDAGITYWARIKGFSGEIGDILANGVPDGPAIVQIKAADAGFITQGSGSWTLVDPSYNPEKMTEFGPGTYIVGKDIEPGTYKSDGSVSYWARLNNFTGDIGAISANGVPSGPAIVKIKATDKGFSTSGGTWKKVK